MLNVCGHRGVLVVHHGGMDFRHDLKDFGCRCVPRVECAVCRDMLRPTRGEAGDKVVHIYPAWSDEQGATA